MNFLHTADWHLGQTFYQYDRYQEHQHFLEWLLQTIEKQSTDVLLISGDVFDTANPSVAATKQFYHFLHQATERFPALQIVAIAGNHDSPVRLEMPAPLLENTHIHLVGYIRRTADKQIDYNRLILPLFKGDEVAAYLLAVPFLRLGDYPKNEETPADYAQGVAAFYTEITCQAVAIAQGNPLIAMGHLHASGAEINDDDTAERPIIGGIESISTANFSQALQYVALGHIHKAQALGGTTHIRYAGSPIPLSFAEKHYEHQVIAFSLEEGKVQHIESLPIPLHTPLLSIPDTYRPAEEVLNALMELPDAAPTDNIPYLEVKVLLNEPAPELKSSIFRAIAHKQVRLARIDVRYLHAAAVAADALQSELTLRDLQPVEVLERVYQNKYHEDLPTTYRTLFEEALHSIDNS
ncbi:exonuclease SbcCD subunit D [Capnocytophaga leadbetteri]|uniref:exonuclease SbcCD subunit D n=1 Tax=Capnocytophaga leadbetteri TaxID=327575 RepID=UPI0028D26DA0|nr:exonuclease SbcCD subunit D C-terminal domain-containing protein [Capnocytophaga leadbetteri]